MPGIVGIINNKPKSNNEKILDEMICTMKHEAFYSVGKYVNEDIGLYVGWICHKNSYYDCNPIFNEKKDIILIFYGENHMDIDSINKLKGRNHQFNKWNASCLVHMYEEDEKGFFEQLNGWFSGMIIDLRDQKAILFNDRYGVKRIYYHENNDTFYFASEAKAILEVNPSLKEIVNKSLAEFVLCNCVLENRTLFKDIFLLPAGSRWCFKSGKIIEKAKYFNLSEWENQPLLEPESFYYKLKETFKKVLARYIISKDKIVFSLTGGLDTRMIISNMEIPSKRMICYSLAGIHRECLDSKIARRIAETCGLEHHSIRLDQEFLDKFPSIAEKTVYITDGSMDISGAPSLYLHSKVRQLGDIRLTGNSGGQVMKCIRDLKAVFPKVQLYDQEFTSQFYEVAKRLRDISSGHPLSFILFKQVPWFSNGRLSCEESQIIERTPFMDNDLIQVLYQATSDLLSDREITYRLISEGPRSIREIPTDRGLIIGGNRLQSFLLHAFREIQFKLEYYYSYGMPQWLTYLESNISHLSLEKMFIERHKYFNMRILFRDELSQYIKGILLEERTLSRPFIKKDILVKIVNSHINGKGNYAGLISQILTIEYIFRSLIEN